MKKFVLLFILSAYVLTSTGVNELLKFNKLTCHFQETKQFDGSIDFLEFLAMHYFFDDNNSSDDARDKELPFKSSNLCFNLVLLAAPLQQISILKAAKLCSHEFFVSNHSETVLCFQSQIWQPPKQV